ncbi:MAG: DNA mismatch repair protein MutS [Haloarculaceae archaeon]
MTEAAGIVGEFLALKEDTDADLLAMQCGDFYEFFGDDAETVADELDLKVSQKSSHGSSYPMAGVPVDELTPYLAALVERGYRVAVADQYETDDGGHARQIERVISPGTVLETTDADARYLAALVEGAGGRGAGDRGGGGRGTGDIGGGGRGAGGRGDAPRYGLAFADVTTGQFHVTGVEGTDAEADLLSELYRFAPVEILPGPALRTDDAVLDRIRERTDAMLTLHTAEAFAPGRARHRVRDHFGAETLESVGIAGDDAAVRAAGAVLAYVEETGAGVLASMTRLQAHGASNHVELDATTQRNLEITETMQGGTSGSLFATVDHSVTSAGGRRLKEWLQRPSQALGELDRRQRAVAALTEAAMAREELRDLLDGAYDLERLAARATSGSADPRDLRGAAETLARLPAAADLVAGADRLADSPLADVLADPDREAIEGLAGELDEALVDDPPGTVTKGGILDPAYDETLEDLVERHEAALEWIETLPERESRRLDITHLSVDRNKTDGYYVQVGNSETGKVPEEYRQIKSLKNSERYTLPELEERERDILRLEEQRYELERDLFEDLRDRVADRSQRLQDAGRALATVDALAGLATHAVRNDWTRPDLSDGDELVIEGGRHPVVEQTTEFVPNDLAIGAGVNGGSVGGGSDAGPSTRAPAPASESGQDRQFLIVTGPNMSGKSTYMRQAALIVLLAQVGSFVPASRARVGLVDGIYTRVGALDELAQGRSTFMVEMQELSNILHSATEDSLVILDEVGRGTATYDGISIAWAATEYLHNEVRAKTLFATHYHELTTLADHLPRVENVHVAVDGEPRQGSGDNVAAGSPGDADDEVTFLRTVREGPTDRSYGVHVADLAGVPTPVVERSREVLDRLREEKAIEARGGDGGDPVQAVFDLSSGEFRGTAHPDGGAAGEDPSNRIADDPAPLRDRFGDDAEAVLDALADLDVEETPPVDLLARVQDWQDRLDGG